MFATQEHGRRTQDARASAAEQRGQALGGLYRAYGGAIYARCKRLLRDEAAAMDATQEVFVRVLRHIGKTPPAEQALRWIYRIATNYCLNQLRDRRRLVPLAEARVRVPADTGAEARAVNEHVVRQLIAEVPERLAAAAWLCWVDGLSQQEAADVLGVSRRTIVYWLAEFEETALGWLGRR